MYHEVIVIFYYVYLLILYIFLCLKPYPEFKDVNFPKMIDDYFIFYLV